MINYNNLFNLISLILVLIILFIIIYGCQYKTRENFENSEENKSEEKKEDKKEDKKKTDTGIPIISSFENSIMQGLTSGSLTVDGLTKIIKDGQFTSTNLENIISYVEHFKGAYNN